MATKKVKKRKKFVPPKKVPEIAFYDHYKRDPNGTFNNYAYVLIGVGCHTEDNCRPLDRFHGTYLPLYEEAAVYKAGKGTLHDSRPLTMFMSNVRKGGKTLKRQLRMMYPELVALFS
jgi:hypothetical protein